MSRQYVEAHNSAVGGASCSYATLSHYNSVSKGVNPPVPRGTVSGYYIVPAYGAPGYNTLKYGSDCNCSSYPSIGDAYRNKGGNCNQKYITKMCR